MTVVGLISPGEMGAFVGAAVAARGADVVWAGAGRSDASRARAGSFRDVGTVTALAVAAEVVVSVCPPHAALEVARAVAAAGFTGLYVDANAVSPSTVQAVAAALPGATCVDGSIIGPPVAGRAVLHLSGPEAERAAALFGGEAIDVRILTGRPIGAASALKVSFAAATKAVGALLITAADNARHYDVYDELVATWSALDPDLLTRADPDRSGAGAKAWRFVGEMTEAAECVRAAGLPDGFWLAAADAFGRLAAVRESGQASTG